MNDQANRLRQLNEMMGSSRSAILKPIQTQARVITVPVAKAGSARRISLLRWRWLLPAWAKRF